MSAISPFAPRPVLRPVMLQRWQSLTFLHWPYEPATIQALLPPQVTLDTFDGAAWVALTPFILSNLRPPLLPRLPWLSRFPETNVRTYVRGPGGEPGVWFFTLEASRLIAVLGARAFYHLPYRWAGMRVRRIGNQVEYRSRRKYPFGSGRTGITIQPGASISAGNFENFLTARYRLYTVHRKRLLFAAIHHEPWRLQSAQLVRLEQDLIQHSGVPAPVGEPVLHFSANIAVRIGRLQRFTAQT